MVRHAGSRGFTLLEMLLVIVIFGFLLTLVAPKIDLQKFTVDSAMQSAGTTLLVAQRLAVTRQHNIIVAFDVPAEAMRILDDANNNGQADPGEHLRVVPLGEHIVYGQGGAPPLGTWAGPISFTKTFGTLPAVTFHRDGSASEAGAVYLTTARAAAGPGPAGVQPPHRRAALRRRGAAERLQEDHRDGERPRAARPGLPHGDGGGPMMRAAPRPAAGFTLVELLVALVVFSAVMAGTLGFLRSQGRAMSLGSDRMNAVQNLQFALSTIEQRLRAAGANLPGAQPAIIYAGRNVVAFNADYATNVPNDPFAIYYDPDVPAGAVTALTKAQRITLPLTTVGYPDTSYTTGGINSPAETMIFFVAPDSTTARGDDYILFEQVNGGPPDMVSRNIIGSPTTVYFDYYRLASVAGTLSIDSLPAARLPLVHTVPIHLAPADTGAAAVIDSIRGIRVTFTVTNGLSGAAERR